MGTRMLRVIMSPILSSLHNWLFQGDYGGVLKDSIFKDSIYGLKRDRSFWTKLYTIRSDGVISPLLIQRIDVILLVGRSMNLLKAINSSHPLFQIETPRELDLVNYSRQSIELWESDLERWKTHVSVEQDELEENFFQAKANVFEEKSLKRKLANEQIDKANQLKKEREIAEKRQKIEEVQKNLAEQLKLKQIEKQKEIEAEKLLEEKIKSEKMEIDRIVEEEKEKMISEFEGKKFQGEKMEIDIIKEAKIEAEIEKMKL